MYAEGVMGESNSKCFGLEEIGKDGSTNDKLFNPSDRLDTLITKYASLPREEVHSQMTSGMLRAYVLISLNCI